MKPKGTLLILDDNKDVLASLALLLDDEFDELITLCNPAQLLSTLRQKKVDVVLLDMNFAARIQSGNEGLYWLHRILEHDASVAVVLFTAWGDVGLAVRAMKEGAADFVLKPWDNQGLTSVLQAAFRRCVAAGKANPGLAAISDTPSVPVTRRPISFVSPRARSMMSLVEKVAPADVTILLTGESGTGKSALARFIHERSLRKEGPFVEVDMATIHPNLIESELFGHRKGAFTDAATDRKGRVAEAAGGTLFLDEIGNLPLESQAKLLQVVQTKRVTPLGSNEVVSVDFRLIAATNHNLALLVDKGQFRADLYYRLKLIDIVIPPLRERREDVAVLAEGFLQRFTEQYNKPALKFADDFLMAVLRYPWPGNIRELQHTVERAVILSDGEITATMMPDRRVEVLPDNGQPRSLDEIERDAIVKALQKHGGNQVKAARELNITRQTIYNKMKKYGL